MCQRTETIRDNRGQKVCSRTEGVKEKNSHSANRKVHFYSVMNVYAFKGSVKQTIYLNACGRP